MSFISCDKFNGKIYQSKDYRLLTLDQRKYNYQIFKEYYEDRIPLIIIYDNNFNYLYKRFFKNNIDFIRKFGCTVNNTLKDVIDVLNKDDYYKSITENRRIKFYSFNKVEMYINALISEIYVKYKSEDEFLYLYFY